MHKNMLKKISSMVLIITIASSHSSLQSDWHDFVSDNTAALCLLATTTACIIGKMSCDLYREYIWPNKKIIDHCRTTYTTIYNDIQIYYNTYKSNSQLSDWDLKEYITHIKTPYPFIAYNERIVRTLFKLIKHTLIIDRELKRINKRKNQLLNNNSKESILLIEEFTQLEEKGKSLQKYIKKTCSILSILKHRIALFEEYDNDFDNWSYAQQKNKDSMKRDLELTHIELSYMMNTLIK